jgi:hypothetical protein
MEEYCSQIFNSLYFYWFSDMLNNNIIVRMDNFQPLLLYQEAAALLAAKLAKNLANIT